MTNAISSLAPFFFEEYWSGGKGETARCEAQKRETELEESAAWIVSRLKAASQ